MFLLRETSGRRRCFPSLCSFNWGRCTAYKPSKYSTVGYSWLQGSKNIQGKLILEEKKKEKAPFMSHRQATSNCFRPDWVFPSHFCVQFFSTGFSLGFSLSCQETVVLGYSLIKTILAEKETALSVLIVPEESNINSECTESQSAPAAFCHKGIGLQHCSKNTYIHHVAGQLRVSQLPCQF